MLPRCEDKKLIRKFLGIVKYFVPKSGLGKTSRRKDLSLARPRKPTVCASALSAPANVEEMAGCDDRTRRRTIGVMTAWLLEFLLASPRERFDILGGELLQVAFDLAGRAVDSDPCFILDLVVRNIQQFERHVVST